MTNFPGSSQSIDPTRPKIDVNKPQNEEPSKSSQKSKVGFTAKVISSSTAQTVKGIQTGKQPAEGLYSQKMDELCKLPLEQMNTPKAKEAFQHILKLRAAENAREGHIAPAKSLLPGPIESMKIHIAGDPENHQMISDSLKEARQLGEKVDAQLDKILSLDLSRFSYPSEGYIHDLKNEMQVEVLKLGHDINILLETLGDLEKSTTDPTLIKFINTMKVFLVEQKVQCMNMIEIIQSPFIESLREVGFANKIIAADDRLGHLMQAYERLEKMIASLPEDSPSKFPLEKALEQVKSQIDHAFSEVCKETNGMLDLPAPHKFKDLDINKYLNHIQNRIDYATKFMDGNDQKAEFTNILICIVNGQRSKVWSELKLPEKLESFLQTHVDLLDDAILEKLKCGDKNAVVLSLIAKNIPRVSVLDESESFIHDVDHSIDTASTYSETSIRSEFTTTELSVMYDNKDDPIFALYYALCSMDRDFPPISEHLVQVLKESLPDVQNDKVLVDLINRRLDEMSPGDLKTFMSEIPSKLLNSLSTLMGPTLQGRIKLAYIGQLVDAGKPIPKEMLPVLEKHTDYPLNSVESQILQGILLNFEQGKYPELKEIYSAFRESQIEQLKGSFISYRGANQYLTLIQDPSSEKLSLLPLFILKGAPQEIEFSEYVTAAVSAYTPNEATVGLLRQHEGQDTFSNGEKARGFLLLIVEQLKRTSSTQDVERGVEIVRSLVEKNLIHEQDPIVKEFQKVTGAEVDFKNRAVNGQLVKPEARYNLFGGVRGEELQGQFQKWFQSSEMAVLQVSHPSDVKKQMLAIPMLLLKGDYIAHVDKTMSLQRGVSQFVIGSVLDFEPTPAMIGSVNAMRGKLPEVAFNDTKSRSYLYAMIKQLQEPSSFLEVQNGITAVIALVQNNLIHQDDPLLEQFSKLINALPEEKFEGTSIMTDLNSREKCIEALNQLKNTKFPETVSTENMTINQAIVFLESFFSLATLPKNTRDRNELLEKVSNAIYVISRSFEAEKDVTGMTKFFRDSETVDNTFKKITVFSSYLSNAAAKQIMGFKTDLKSQSAAQETVKGWLHFYLDLADKCKQKNDLNGFQAIFITFNMAAIGTVFDRLKGTNEFDKELESINQLFDPSKNFKNMREYMEEHKSELLIHPPVIAVKDLEFAKAGNEKLKTRDDGQDDYNFQRPLMSGKIVGDFLRGSKSIQGTQDTESRDSLIIYQSQQSQDEVDASTKKERRAIFPNPR